VVADAPERWAAFGFTVADGCCQLGGVRVRLVGGDAGQGIVSWSLRGIADGAELDGLPTERSDVLAPASVPVSPSTPAPNLPSSGTPAHPNGVIGVDHVVAMSPALDRTVAALRAAGLDLRRIREQPTPAGAPRQAFFRLGEEILEVVQEPEEVVERAGGPTRPARLWGIAVNVADLDRTVAGLDADLVSPIRAAVQPGRRIATFRRSAGLAIPLALMSRRPIDYTDV